MKGSVSGMETSVPRGKSTAPSCILREPSPALPQPGLCRGAGRGKMIHGLPPAEEGPAHPC